MRPRQGQTALGKRKDYFKKAPKNESTPTENEKCSERVGQKKGKLFTRIKKSSKALDQEMHLKSWVSELSGKYGGVK